MSVHSVREATVHPTNLRSTHPRLSTCMLLRGQALGHHMVVTRVTVSPKEILLVALGVIQIEHERTPTLAILTVLMRCVVCGTNISTPLAPYRTSHASIVDHTSVVLVPNLVARKFAMKTSLKSSQIHVILHHPWRAIQTSAHLLLHLPQVFYPSQPDLLCS